MVDAIKNAAIAQLNFSYVPQEDRVLFRIGLSNQTELMAWLTRRITLQLWQLLTETTLKMDTMAETHTQEAGRLKEAFAKESAAQQHDYTTPFEARQVLNPNELFLVHACKLSAQPEGGDNLQLDCTNGQSLNIIVNDDLRYAIINMLQLVTKESEWGLSFSSQPALLNTLTGSHALH